MKKRYKKYFMMIVERAERIDEGEDWDLLELVLRLRDEDSLERRIDKIFDQAYERTRGRSR